MLKNYEKEKITQIMKKNKVEFVSAEFGAGLLCLSWYKPMSDTVPV